MPQPETVRDLDVQIEREGGWETVVEVRGNYQRWLSLVLPTARETAALRLPVLAMVSPNTPKGIS